MTTNEEILDFVICEDGSIMELGDYLDKVEGSVPEDPALYHSGVTVRIIPLEGEQ